MKEKKRRKKEGKKRGLDSFSKFEKKNINEEEDEMDFFPHGTSTRNESCCSLRVDICNCHRSEARGPLSLPAGKDGQDHNQLRATHNQILFFF